jgi:hypothetical protein
MKQNKWSKILLIAGMLILLVGAILSLLKQPCADYVLILGAALLLIRNPFRTRERIQNDDNEPSSNE